MKKLVLFIVAVAMTAVSAKTFAQSTGINPMVDSTHTYTVANHSGNSYAWTLESSAAGGGSDLFGSGSTDVAEITGGSGTNSITVYWNNPAVDGTIYYLHVTETDAEGCTNRKVLAVQPENNFQIDVVNVLADGSLFSDGDSLDHSTCAPAIPNSISWNGSGDVDDLTEAQNFNYDYGTVYFYYKITASGLNFETTSWIPELSIAQVGGTNATVSIDTIIGGDLSGTPSWQSTGWNTGTSYTPTIPAGNTNNVIWVRITVANGVGTPSTANENISDNDYTFSIGAGSKDANDNLIVNTPDNPVQTQSARPDTGIISID